MAAGGGSSVGPATPSDQAQGIRRRADRLRPSGDPPARHDRGVTLGHCDSCGDDGVDVIALHRIYLTPEAWDQEEKVEVLDSVEHWCFPCRSSYPHQLIE